MRAIDVCVGHDDDAVVSQFGKVKGAAAVLNPCAERNDQRADVIAPQDLVDACLLHVEQLAAQREDRLEATIASLLCRTTG